MYQEGKWLSLRVKYEINKQTEIILTQRQFL